MLSESSSSPAVAVREAASQEAAEHISTSSDGCVEEDHSQISGRVTDSQLSASAGGGQIKHFEEEEGDSEDMVEEEGQVENAVEEEEGSKHEAEVEEEVYSGDEGEECSQSGEEQGCEEGLPVNTSGYHIQFITDCLLGRMEEEAQGEGSRIQAQGQNPKNCIKCLILRDQCLTTYIYLI